MAKPRGPRAMGLGDVTGSLVEGLSADFIVPDRDLFAVDTGDIHQTQVQQTWFEGKLVYDTLTAND